MATTSRIPAGIDALLGVLAVRPALAQVDIIDGPPLAWGAIKLATSSTGDGQRYLFIGAGLDGTMASEGVQEFNAAGAVSRDERFEVLCVALAWSGDGAAVKATRDLAFALVGEVEQAIRADPSLGNAVLYCLLSSVDRHDQIQQPDRGLSVTVSFRVAFRAYLS